jgi:endonuclease G, mitochondrial
MAKNSGNRALLILFTSLILVVLLITFIARIGAGELIVVVGNRVGDALGEAGRYVGESVKTVADRPLASGISDYLEDPETLTVPVSLDEMVFEILEKEGFILAYCADRKIPLWVGYELTAKELEGEFPRLDYFKKDADMGEDSPVSSSYTGSGYDRGHMIPAADVKWSEEAMTHSFLMSNVAPQIPALNRGAWRELEEAIRDLVKIEGALIIITGPVLTEAEYPRIAEGGTVIPEYYFKVVLDYSDPGVHAWGFLMPNTEEMLADREYGDFLFSVDRVEEFTGYDFFAPLPDDLEEQLENRASPLF